MHRDPQLPDPRQPRSPRGAGERGWGGGCAGGRGSPSLLFYAEGAGAASTAAPLLTHAVIAAKRLTHLSFPEDSLQPGSSEPRERLPACLIVRECVHACVGACWPAGLCEAMGRIKAIRILPEFPLLDRAPPPVGPAACRGPAPPPGQPQAGSVPLSAPPSLAVTCWGGQCRQRCCTYPTVPLVCSPLACEGWRS